MMNKQSDTQQRATVQEAIEEARVCGQAYALLAELFFYEPRKEFLQDVAQLVSKNVEGAPAANPLYFQAAANEITNADTAGKLDALHEDICVDYARLFANASHNPVHPYESVYLGKNHILMEEPRDEVVAAYTDGAYEVSDKQNLPEDHAGYECAYMARLSFDYADALEQGESDHGQAAKAIIAAQKDFFLAHPAKWFLTLAQDIEDRAQTEFYRDFAHALVAVTRIDICAFAENAAGTQAPCEAPSTQCATQIHQGKE